MAAIGSPSTPTITIISGRSERLGDFLVPHRAARHLLLQRNLIFELVRADFVSRYRGSLLGALWVVINPLLLLSIYTFVFSGILRARWPGIQDADPLQYALRLFVGLVIFSFVSECFSRSPSAISAVPNYVKKVVFPLEVLPVTVVISALINTAIGFTILIAANGMLTGRMSLVLLLLPLLMAPAVFLVLGVSWILASVGVFVRDVNLAIGFIIQILFFLTPIFYPIDAVPDPWRSLLQWNPLALVIEDTRTVILSGDVPALGPLFGLIAIMAIFALVGYGWFMKTKRAFADAL